MSPASGPPPSYQDPRMVAAVDLLGRTGASEFQLRYCDEETPLIWSALAKWGGHWEVGSSLDPLRAVFRLCDEVIDGGTCQHCGRPTGFAPDLDPMPLEPYVCWYQWEPGRETFKRGCEALVP